MKQTLLSTHFLLKPPTVQISTPTKETAPLKRKARFQKTKPLEKKLKSFETPVNNEKKPLKMPLLLNWKGTLKHETPLADIFTHNMPFYSEKSTTQGTFEGSNSFISSLHYQNQINYLKTPQMPASFRKISFDEEPVVVNTMEIEENKRPIAISKETEEILKEIKSKSSLKEQLKKTIEDNKSGFYKGNEDYKRVLIKFETLENALLMTYFRKEASFYKNLHEITKITMKELQQILFVFPNEYTLKWEKNNQFKQEIDLLITFPSDMLIEKSKLLKNIESRKELFRQRALNLFKSQQQAKNDDFNFIIPEQPLPKKPSQPHIETLREFLQKTQPKNKELYTIMKETASKTEEKVDIKEEKPLIEGILAKKGLRESLIEKIKMKEKMLEETKKTVEKPKKIQEMTAIVEIIKYHFTLRGVNNMFLSNLTTFIHSSNNIFIMSEEEIAGLIRKIAEIAPDWMKLIDNENGKIVRVNKEMAIFNVLTMIKAL